MTARRRVFSAAAILALLALNLGCPSCSGPPHVDHCSNAPDDATIDGIAAQSHFQTGLQGSTMILTDVEWLGAGAPSCARAHFVLRDDTGQMIDERDDMLSTDAADGGRAASTSVFFIPHENLCHATVDVTSYGHTATADVWSNGYLCPHDGGPGDDASAERDAATPARTDAGTARTDAGTARTDAGTARTDAGTARTDAGTARTDAGTARTDAGTARTDAGTARDDAGTARTDAGTARTDAGTARTDAGTARTDGG